MTETHEMPNLPRPPRRAWRSLVLGLVLLASGTAIGASSAVFFVERQIVSTQNETPERRSDRATKEMRSRLDLTPEQSEQLRAIFRKHHESIKAIREETRPRFETELQKMRMDVNAILTPEQAKQWEAKFERSRKRWLYGGRDGPRRDGRGGPPPPPRRWGDGRPSRGPEGHDGRPGFDGPPREGPHPPPVD